MVACLLLVHTLEAEPAGLFMEAVAVDTRFLDDIQLAVGAQAI